MNLSGLYMKRKYSQKPLEQRKIAVERINKLFNEAKLAFNKDSSLSNKYVGIARKIAMKMKVRIPRELRRRFCKHCHSYLAPSKNCTVRLQKSKVVYHCNKCNGYMRFPYVKEQKKKRARKYSLDDLS